MGCPYVGSPMGVFMGGGGALWAGLPMGWVPLGALDGGVPMGGSYGELFTMGCPWDVPMRRGFSIRCPYGGVLWGGPEWGITTGCPYGGVPMGETLRRGLYGGVHPCRGVPKRRGLTYGGRGALGGSL